HDSAMRCTGTLCAATPGTRRTNGPMNWRARECGRSCKQEGRQWPAACERTDELMAGAIARDSTGGEKTSNATGELGRPARWPCCRLRPRACRGSRAIAPRTGAGEVLERLARSSPAQNAPNRWALAAAKCLANWHWPLAADA